MTWIYFVFSFACGLMAGYFTGHFAGMHDMLEYDIDTALRESYAHGYLTRAREELKDD